MDIRSFFKGGSASASKTTTSVADNESPGRGTSMEASVYKRPSGKGIIEDDEEKENAFERKDAQTRLL